jgi:hypothetical protein
MWSHAALRSSVSRSVFALMCVVVASGCGGTLPFGSDSTVDPKADRLAAKAAVLKQGDLPGFTATPHKESTGFTPEDEKLLAKCLKIDVAVFEEGDNGQSATSPDFKRGDLEIGSEVEIDPDASGIDAVFDVLNGGRFEKCLSVLMTFALAKESRPGIEIGPPTFLRQTSKLGDRATRFMGEVTISAPGIAQELHMEMLFVREGRAVIALTSNDLESIDTARSDRLVKTMLGRLDGHT